MLKKMLHGGDYNPEQWLHSPEILEKDIEYFKKAKNGNCRRCLSAVSFQIL